MWIFSKTGMFSVVKDNQRPGFMLVRARCALDIANLYRDHKDALPSMTEPTSDETRDYRWRSSLSHADFVTLAGRLAEQVTYSNFKSAVAKEPTQGDKTEVYHRVWAELLALQRAETDGEPVNTQTGDQDAADKAWEAFVAKVDKPTGEEKKNRPSARLASDREALVSIPPKYPFVRVDLADLLAKPYRAAYYPMLLKRCSVAARNAQFVRGTRSSSSTFKRLRSTTSTRRSCWRWNGGMSMATRMTRRSAVESRTRTRWRYPSTEDR